jgi:hypothetical protein
MEIQKIGKHERGERRGDKKGLQMERQDAEGSGTYQGMQKITEGTHLA